MSAPGAHAPELGRGVRVPQPRPQPSALVRRRWGSGRGLGPVGSRAFRCTPGVVVRSAGSVTASPAPLPGRVSREPRTRTERLEPGGRRPGLLRRRPGREAAGSAGENGRWPGVSPSARPLLRTRGWGSSEVGGRDWSWGAPGAKVTGAAGSQSVFPRRGSRWRWGGAQVGTCTAQGETCAAT